MSYPADPNDPNAQNNAGQPGAGQQPYGHSYPANGNYGAQSPGGQQNYGQPSLGQVPPDNNMVWAILSTVLCCLPLGIVAIIKASSVNSLWAQGDHAGAQRAASEAGKWAMWSAIVTVILGVLFIILWFAIFAAAVNSGNTTTTTY